MQSDYTYCKEYTSPKDTSKTFTIRSLVKSDIDNVVKLMVQTHEVCHPMLICIPYRPDIYSQMLTRIITNCWEEDLSVVVIDKSTGDLAGVIWGKDLFTKEVDNSDLIAQWPEFKSYAECIAIFNSRLPEYLTVTGPMQIMKMFYMTVNVKYQTYGLATQLISCLADHPKISQYPIIIGQGVSKFTVNIVAKFEQMGAKVIDSVEYEKFQASNGEYPFKNIKEELKKKNLSNEHGCYTFIVYDKTKNNKDNQQGQ